MKRQVLSDPDFINYYNLNRDFAKYHTIKLKVMGTTFASNVTYLKHDSARDWIVAIDKYKSTNSKGKKGIDAKIKYNDLYFDATINAQGKTKTTIGKVYTSDEEFKEEEVTRCIDGYFKISTKIDFTSAIEDIFWATRLAKRMALPNKTVDLGEYMNAKVFYGIMNGEPKVLIDIQSLHPLESMQIKPTEIILRGERIPYDFCKLIEEKFSAEHICIQPENPSDEIEWSVPTDWIEPDNKEHMSLYEAAFNIKYGVYMWIGVKKSEPHNKYLYIGIVGTDRNKRNTVGNRIFNQEMKNEKGIGVINGIDKIECFRYSELRNSGKFSPGQVLQTVEMQCINNFSAIFGYNAISLQSEPEPIIHFLYDGVLLKGQGYTLQMLNQRKRYNNS